ncbi:hypothetical protein KR067_002697 [Drosophila pandora]|nr:hypothetical protein KR067_002697 [Drosophila pandora]
MTIPSRPAPAPPGSRGQSAAAGANASLEQLRVQLQQQHLQQQQAGGGLQKLNIKLPPPPKGPLQSQNSIHRRINNINNNNNEPTGSSITRKFPQARYTPATNWDDDPFVSNGNDRFKKMAPPRPPPPKVLVNGQKMAPNSTSTAATNGGGINLISNIFHRKKSTSTAAAAASKAAAQSRVYGLSSGHSETTSTASGGTSAASYNDGDWNAAWNTATTVSNTTTSSSNSRSHYSSQQMSTVTEGALISFDSPPSSPTFTQKSNSDCVSVDSFSSDSNFSSPNNGSVSQPESGFEDDYHRSRPATQSPLDPWEAVDAFHANVGSGVDSFGTAPVRQTYQSVPSRSSDNPLCNGKSLLPPTQSLTMPTIIKPKISAKPKAPKPPPFIGGLPPGYGGSDTPPSPPMPKGAPPPLPQSAISMLDVISGKVDATALSNGAQGYIQEEVVPYAIALYNFDGVEEGDLSFRENEKIYLLDQPAEEWLRGRSRSGCEGIFPANYVEVIVPLGSVGHQSSASGASSGAAAPAATNSQHQQNRMPTAYCLYNFPGEVEGDLALRENELVTLLYKINDEWLFGEVDGRQGQFPANFLDQVPDNLPTL